MEDFIERFPHIAEQIFQELDNKSLTTCREVAHSWHQFIDSRNLTWQRILQIPEFFRRRNTNLHVAAMTGQTAMFEKMIENEVNINPVNDKRKTPLEFAMGRRPKRTYYS